MRALARWHRKHRHRRSVIEIVLAADKERTALLKEAETATDPNRIAEIQMRLVDIDAHSAEARAASILAGLGFDAEAQARPRLFLLRRLAHARGACGRFVLGTGSAAARRADELSRSGRHALAEDYVRRYPHTVVIISHDRDLLKMRSMPCASRQKKLTFYRGGYDSFERQKAEADELQMKAKAKNDAARKHLQSFIDRFRAKATKARQAQSRIKALERMGTVAP